MKDKLKILLQLQACDSRISEINDKKNDAPLRIQKLHNALKRCEDQLREDTENLESLIKDRRQVEQKIQDFDRKIEKSNTKLSNIKSNKEYTAALKEIEDLKGAKAQSEDELLQFMEEIERLEQKKEAGKEEQLRLQKGYETDKRVIEDELSVLDRELEGLKKRSGHLSEASDKDILKRYALLRERKGGLAVCAVIAGVCQACHMGIPPQTFNELLKGSTLMTCPHCNRMIYWGEDEQFIAAWNDAKIQTC
ncbi:MAG: zinc ribbon domain-containing protein [Desulfatiglandales bacterium]